MLYYPEEGDDYGAYLPLKDEISATISNENGHFMVGEEVIEEDFVNNYSDLIEMGKADIGEVVDYTEGEVINDTISIFPSQLRAVNYGDGTAIYAYFIRNHSDWNGTKTKVGGDKYEHNTGWRQVGNGKKIKVTFGRVTRPVYNIGFLPKGFKMDWHIEVSFRKKGFLGIWYNYSSETNTSISLYYQEPDIAPVHKYWHSTGTSSHDHYFRTEREHLIQPWYDSWGNVYDADNRKKQSIQCLYRMYGYMAFLKIEYRGMSTPMNLIFMNMNDLYGYTAYVSDKLY